LVFKKQTFAYRLFYTRGGTFAWMEVSYSAIRAWVGSAQPSVNDCEASGAGKKKAQALSHEGLFSTKQCWLPDLDSNQGPAD